MDTINIFDITTGTYKGINDQNREKYRVKFTDDLLTKRSYMHEFLNPGQNYILFLDYDDLKLNLCQCISKIMAHLVKKGIPATESMIKVVTKAKQLKFHFYIPALHATLDEQKEFWQGLEINYDSCVYRRGFFRLPNQMKPAANGNPAQKLTYQPLGETELNDCILGNIPWYSSKVTIYKIRVINSQPIIVKNDKCDFECSSISSFESRSLEGGFYDYSEETKISILAYLLSHLDSSYYEEYSKWLKIGTILKGAFDSEERGFDMFLWFSKKSNKYPGKNVIINHWNNWDSDKITFGSLKFMVPENIWKSSLLLGKSELFFEDED